MDSLITTVLGVALVAVTLLLGVSMGGDVILNYQAKAEASRIISDAQSIAGAWREFARGNNGDPTLTGYCWGSSGATDLATAYLSRLPAPPTGAADNTINYYYPALVANYGTNGATTKVGPSKKPADSIALKLKSWRVCNAIAAQAGYPAASAIPSLSGNLTAVGTSTTSVLIATGSNTFTTQTGLIIPANEGITVASSANAANYMSGTVTSYNSGTGALVVNVTTTGGAGTLASWNVIPNSQPYDCIYVDSDSSGGPSQGDNMLFVYRVFDQNLFTASARTACP